MSAHDPSVCGPACPEHGIAASNRRESEFFTGANADEWADSLTNGPRP